MTEDPPSSAAINREKLVSTFSDIETRYLLKTKGRKKKKKTDDPEEKRGKR